MPTIEFLPNIETPRALQKLKRNTSLGDVSRATGISREHVSRIFNGRRNPSLKVAEKIATYLNVSVDDLLVAISEQLASADPRNREVAA